MKNTMLRILAVEDISTDVELAHYELVRAGIACKIERVETQQEFVDALEAFRPDVILCDFSLPEFDGLSALNIAKGSYPDIPFLFVSGTIGEERAIKALKLGAYDYVLKTNLARLPSAVKRALQEAGERLARIQAEQALQAERNLLSAIFDTTGSLGLMLDTEGRIVRFNQASERSTGFQSLEVTGRYFWDLFFASDDAAQEKMRFATWHTQAQPLQYQSNWLTRNGDRREILWLTTALKDESGTIINFISSGIDITQWRQAESRIHQLSNFDTLTGLPNRSLLRDRLDQAKGRGERDGGLIALMLIDVRGITQVREGLGHVAGDLMMVEVSRRLLQWRQNDETLARFGDTSFAVVLQVNDQDNIAGAVQQVLDTLDRPYQLSTHEEIFLESSIGVTVYPNDGDNLDSLLQGAEVALHRAVENAHERYQFYTPELNLQVSNRLQLATQLRHALSRNELALFYQPQVSLRTGEIVGLEALLRWKHPDKGLIPPLQFIPLAEETGVILVIGEWVLRTACAQGKAWQDKGLAPMTIAVNLSAKQFAQKNLESIIQNALSDSGLAAQYLELELTESASMESPEKSIVVMNKLKAMGVRLSIDDFGTGYSNLNYLKRFPVDLLKIDQSFIREVTADPDDLAIAKAVIALGNSLHLEVIAEGVETEGQLALMAAHGCDRIQGYYFSRPLPVEQCTELLINKTGLSLEKIGRQRYARTLLMIDDELNMLSAMKRALRGKGYEIFAANTAKQAFEILAMHDVGVVLADQRMPELNGTELLNRIKDMYPDTVRIVLSGYTDLKTVTDAVNHGAIYKFLTKPWDDDVLKKALEGAFKKFEAARASTR